LGFLDHLEAKFVRLLSEAGQALAAQLLFV
jgi:hypothetical protein